MQDAAARAIRDLLRHGQRMRDIAVLDILSNGRAELSMGIGYLGFDGGMDTSIVIRTYLALGNRGYFSVGGGIVVTSCRLDARSRAE